MFKISQQVQQALRLRNMPHCKIREILNIVLLQVLVDVSRVFLMFHQTPNLLCNKFAHVAWQGEGFCILYFAAFMKQKHRCCSISRKDLPTQKSAASLFITIFGNVYLYFLVLYNHAIFHINFFCCKFPCSYYI